MTTFYLHIGLHKTGSSSIQIALSKARRGLRRMGITYPGSEVNHAELYLAFCDHPEREHSNVRRGISTPEAARRSSMQIMDVIANELQLSRSPKVILSAEGLSSLSQSGIERLKAFILPFADRIKVVCFVRNPIGFATSYAQEAVFGGKLIEESLRTPELPQYRNKIGRFVHAFGYNNVVVCDFDAVRQTQEPLLRRFILAIDEAPDEYGFVHEERANVAMTLESVRIFDAINRRYPMYTGTRRNPARANVPRAWLRNVGSTPFNLPRDWQARVYNACKQDVKWLRESFGIEFDSVTSESGGWSAPDSALFDQLAVVLHDNAHLIDECMKEICTLRSTLAERDGNLSAAMEPLRTSLRIDPDQPAIVARLQGLSDRLPLS